MARGGLLNLVGAIGSGVLNFLVVIVITHGLGARGAGAFFVAIAMFSLLSNTLELGADTGVVRTIPRYRALGRTGDIERSIFVALVPVFVASAIAAAAMFLFASQLSAIFSNHSHPEEVAPLVRMLALFLPISSAYTVVVAATRGFGTMVPSVVIDRIGKPALQPLLVQVVIWSGLGGGAVALAWAGPIGVGFIFACLWLVALTRRSGAQRGIGSEQPLPLGRLAAEFWRFTAPRGLAGMFQVTILWLDTLLIGALRSTREAGIYGAATRYMLVGTFAIIAVLQVFGPKMSELIARQDHAAAQSLYQASTAWLVLMTWPLYFTIVLFSPVLVSVFGKSFTAGDTPLVILSLSMLVATACGPVDIVLLMAGKSSWNLLNTLVALTLNIGLNLLLIPRFGITGAGIAWAVSILANNLLPLAQTWTSLKLHPFGRGFPRAAFAAAGTYGGLGLLVRAFFGPTVPSLVVFGFLATTAYACLLWFFRDELELGVFKEALRERRRGHDGAVSSTSVQP